MKVGRPSKITDDHIEFLINKDTLDQQAGLSLDERVILFHRSFPEIKITQTTLARIYSKNGVKFKKINRIKPTAKMNQQRLRELMITMKDEYDQA
jgi:transposase